MQGCSMTKLTETSVLPFCLEIDVTGDFGLQPNSVACLMFHSHSIHMNPSCIFKLSHMFDA